MSIRWKQARLNFGGSCFGHPTFLLGHPATKVKGLKCPSSFVYKIKKWLIRTSHSCALLPLPRYSSFFVFLAASSSFVPTHSFLLLRCCFFFVRVLHCFHSRSVHWHICVLLWDKLFSLSLFVHCFVWMIVGCRRCSLNFFCEQKAIQIDNPYDQYGLLIRMGHTNWQYV